MRRWWIGIAIAVYFAAVFVWLINDRRVPATINVRLSALNTSPSGASLAFHYLERRAHARLLTRALDTRDVPKNAVVFRLQPSVSDFMQLMEQQRDEERDDDSDESPTPAKKKKGEKDPPKRRLQRDDASKRLFSPSEEEWIYGGGRMVIATDTSWGPVRILSEAGATTHASKVFPIWPELPEITPVDPQRLDPPPGMHNLFVAEYAPIVSRMVMGKGELILLSFPSSFENQHLALGKNLALLSTLAAGRPVLFDETIHGVRTDEGLLELMKDWGLGPCLLLTLIVFIFKLWRDGKRIGKAEREAEETRSEAIDLVDSIGQLYTRALSRAEMIAIYRRTFVHAVATQTTLRGKELEKRVQSLAPNLPPERTQTTLTSLDEKNRRHDISRAEFLQQLTSINEGFRRLERAKHH